MHAHLVTKPDAVRFAGLLNRRLTGDVRALEILESENALHTVEELRARIADHDAQGIDPEDLWNLDSNYDVEISWAQAPDRFDATLRRRGALRLVQPKRTFSSRALEPIDWSQFVNKRQQTSDSSDLVRELREHVIARRPDYMVPSAFVMLDALPRTPNGKVDWKSLPEPDRIRQQSAPFVPPANEAEQVIAGVWKQLLNLDRVGADDNFFDLGANSLMMVQAVTPLRERLQCSLSLVDLFRYPSARALAGHMDGSQQPAQEVADSQKRGRARLDAMLRRVHARQVIAEEKGA
jgi:acyl carrier protein